MDCIFLSDPFQFFITTTTTTTLIPTRLQSCPPTHTSQLLQPNTNSPFTAPYSHPLITPQGTSSPKDARGQAQGDARSLRQGEGRHSCRSSLVASLNHPSLQTQLIPISTCLSLSTSQETEKKKGGAERFVTHVESLDEKLKKSTVGLVNLKDFQEKRKALEIEQAIAGAQVLPKSAWLITQHATDRARASSGQTS